MNKIINKSNIHEQLIQLSKIFKSGFTVIIKNGQINQYCYYKYPYIVSIKTLIKIHNKDIVNYGNIPNNCIIGAWLDIETNNYFIELNSVYKSLFIALQKAKEYKQKYIYNIITGEMIKVD